jgi:hypothetical protein
MPTGNDAAPPRAGARGGVCGVGSGVYRAAYCTSRCIRPSTMWAY